MLNLSVHKYIEYHHDAETIEVETTSVARPGGLIMSPTVIYTTTLTRYGGKPMPKRKSVPDDDELSKEVGDVGIFPFAMFMAVLGFIALYFLLVWRV